MQPQHSNYPPPVSPISPPEPPPHRDFSGRSQPQQQGYTTSMASNVTSGADNFSDHAAGGMSGIAMSVAGTHERQSGLEAVQNLPGYHPQYDDPKAYDRRNDYSLPQAYPPPAMQRAYDPYSSNTPYEAHDEYTRPAPPRQEPSTGSQSSFAPLGQHAQRPARISPAPSFQSYSDTPYNRYSRNLDGAMGEFDPNLIEDDGDEGLEYLPHRDSRQALTPHGSNTPVPGAAATGGVLGALGGLVGRKSSAAPSYGPVGSNTSYAPGSYEMRPSHSQEKSEWLARQSHGRRKWTWIAGCILFLVIAGGIAAGVAIPLINKNKASSSSPSGTGSAATDTQQNGDLDVNSAEIQKLLGKKNLHKVFPGMDYTPLNTQYPDCLSNPPSQNNVTRDLAVLSQLTNVLRLYGTDCNQTEMVLHSIDKLGLKGKMKVWMGVWQDGNATTNARQLRQMYTILDAYGADPFMGVVVGNEVLFNQYLSETALITVLESVKANLTAKNIDLKVATSDLGDLWTSNLAGAADVVMANVHPFFAGVPASQAANWTLNFFDSHDVTLKPQSSSSTSYSSSVMISETGWPSAGGTDCGSAATCSQGADAGIDGMNTFLSDWVCSRLDDGVQYFWFEAFDEPWKVAYNTPGKEWEDKWGLMDVNRNLKAGVSIPSCGGKTVADL